MGTISVHPEIMDLFREKVVGKHKKLYGSIQDEAHAALLHHIKRGMPDYPGVEEYRDFRSKAKKEPAPKAKQARRR